MVTLFSLTKLVVKIRIIRDKFFKEKLEIDH